MKKTLTTFGILAGLISIPALAVAASEATGHWYGVAVSAYSDEDERDVYDHETKLQISCDGRSGIAKYTYVDYPGGAVCESTLTLMSVLADGTRSYIDTTRTSRCLDGWVTLKVDATDPTHAHFERRDESYILETQGTVKLTASKFCSKYLD